MPIGICARRVGTMLIRLALASPAKAVGLEEWKDDAKALLAYLKSSFAHPSGGFVESLPPALPRRQNPHMHLLEAMLAAAEAFGDESYLDGVTDIVELFFQRILQRDDGSIPEYFTDDLIPLRVTGLFEVEPGHLHEWVWLLDWWSMLARRPGLASQPTCVEVIASIHAFCDHYANHPLSGLVIDSLWCDGGARSLQVRLWPQTERIKSEFRRQDCDSTKCVHAVQNLLALTDTSVRGLWTERRNADGVAYDGPVPASSLYHITAALMDAGNQVNLLPRTLSTL